jgi:hypothetical protein
MRTVVLGILIAGALVSCVSGIGLDLERESARAIAPTPLPDSVRISDVHHGFNEARWIATTPGGVYDCSMKDGEHQPLCAKREPAH